MEAAIREINQAPNIEHANEGNNIIPVLNIEILQPEAEVGSRSKVKDQNVNCHTKTTMKTQRMNPKSNKVQKHSWKYWH